MFSYDTRNSYKHKQNLTSMFELFSTLAAFAALKATFMLSTYRKKHVKASFVGKVSGIFLYPVKSLTGLSLRQARCTFSGVEHCDIANLSDRFVFVFCTRQSDKTLLHHRKDILELMFARNGCDGFVWCDWESENPRVYSPLVLL